MICTFFADNLLAIVTAMQDDLRLAGIEPMFDTTKIPLRDVYVLAFDQLLPERAKLTPPIAMMVSSAAVTGQRFWHRKKVAAAHDASPETQRFREGLRTEAERKATEAAQKKQAANENASASAKAEPVGPPMSPAGSPTMPAHPPTEAPGLPMNGVAVAPRPLKISDKPPRGFDEDGLY